MKKIISFTLALSTLSNFALAANVCRGSNCKIATGTAAGTMVAGTMAIRGLIKVKDLEAKYTVQIFSASRGSVDDALNKIIDGDRVMVQHNLSKEANLQYHIDKLEAEIEGHYTDSAHHKANAISAAMPKSENVYDSKGNFVRTKMVQGDYAMAQLYNQMAEQSEQAARNTQRELSRVHSGKAQIPVYKFDHYIKNSSMHSVEDYIQGLRSQGSKVVYMNRLPKAIARKVASGARNGWILAATAVTLGLVTAEEIMSGKIARKLDGETQSLRRGY